MIVIGVDPGLHGGIAILTPDDGDTGGWSVSPYVMPLLRDTERDQYDAGAIRRLLARTCFGGPAGRRPARAFVERLHPLPATRADGKRMGGTIANFNRGAATYLWVGILEGLGVAYQLVLPQTWQRAMLEGIPGDDTKARSVWLARRVFPGCSLLATPRSKKPHDGMADALCLAEYGRRILAGGTGRQLGLLEVGA